MGVKTDTILTGIQLVSGANPDVTSTLGGCSFHLIARVLRRGERREQQVAEQQANDTRQG